jgi:cardiolipin synthase
VPHFTDVWFIPWVASAFHLGLLKAGVRVFEYTGTVLHAKTMILDGWALVGSSNLNHRSLLHDLEADVVLPAEKDQVSLHRQFLIDLESAQEITLDTWQSRPWFERWLGRGLLGFRYLL